MSLFSGPLGDSLTKKLEPLHDLEPAGDKWLATGEDPHFLVDLSLPGAGWYHLRVQVDMEYDFQRTQLYFDYGDGFDEKASISLSIESGKAQERYFYLPASPYRVRLDPTTSKGLFAIQAFTITALAEPPLDDVMERLIREHKRFQGLTLEGARDEITQLASRTGAEWHDTAATFYDSTFVARTAPTASYGRWLKEVEERQSRRMALIVEDGFELAPLISILVPVYKTDRQLLAAMIRSVRAQSYHRWELCLVDDASNDPALVQVMKDWQRSDARIKCHFRTENGHISKTSNDALALATGDYCALLDHDDALHPQALAYVVQAINQHPNAGIIYSDEDKIDEHGRRFDPHFKSDWNPDLLYSQNFVSHLGVYRTDLMREVGGFRVGYEGSQDFDLLLRCSERCAARDIVHIPRILYHWRAIEGSTALDSDQKDYTETASIKALTSHFERTGQQVTVERGMMANTFKCTWAIPEPAPMASLLIPTRDGVEVLEQAVRSILDRTTYQNYEILILDNQSEKPETLAFFEQIQQEDKRVRVLAYDYPFNFSGINNFGALFAKGDVIGLINNDIEVISAGWLTEMMSHVMRPEIGCVGAKLYYENDAIQHGGVVIGIGGVAGHSHKYFDREDPGYYCRLMLTQNYSAVTAAVLLVRKEVYLQVGCLRESLAVAFNDVDFCLKVREAGYRNLWTPYAELYHYESVSRGLDESGAKRIRFDTEHEVMRRTWGNALHEDPYYNPNLTKIYENFELYVP